MGTRSGMVGALSIHLKVSGLQKGKHSISAVGSGNICMLKNESTRQPSLDVRMTVKLLPVKQDLHQGWNCIRPYLYAVISPSPYFQDVTLITSSELMWFRTALVLKDTLWYCIEDVVDIIT